MFIQLPCYNASLLSEDRLLNTDHFEEIKPHADVPVDPGAVSTACCEIRFFSNTAIVALLSVGDMKIKLEALTGEIDDTGAIS